MKRLATATTLSLFLFSQISWSQVRPPNNERSPRELPPSEGRVRPLPGGIVKPDEPNPGPVKPIEPTEPTAPVVPNPVTPTPVVPTLPAKKALDRRQLEQIVRSAVNDYTRQILDIVGEAYQVRYNVREGMLRGASRIGNYENEAVLLNTSEYQNAINQGRGEGKDQGASAGRQSANTQSFNVASSEINAAIDRTLNTGAAIQFKQSAQMASFSGSTSSLSYPRGIEARWSDNESSKVSQIRRLLRQDPPNRYLNGLFDLSSIYRSHDTQIPNDFRRSNAFSSWMDNDLNAYSSSGSDARRFYQEITNASLFEQAAQNADLFREAFENSFDRSFDREWDRKVTSAHYGALNLGESLYLNESSAYATDRGYYKGYNDVFTDASITAFSKSYLDLYKSNFSSIENKVRTSTGVSEIQATVVNEEGKAEVTYGDTFNVVVSRIANRGMVAADVSVEIPAQAQITSFPNPRQIRVNGLTRNTATQTFQRLGWISAITAPDQNITIAARIDNQTVNFVARATYEEMLRTAIRTPRADLSAYLMTMALKFMKAQYDDLSGFRDQYAKRDPSMLLVRMRKLFDSLNDAEKTQLRLNSQIIRNVFGGKPPRFLNPKRDEWDASQAMMTEMGLTGVVPELVVNSPSNNYNN